MKWRKVVYTNTFDKQFDANFLYIKENSTQNAQDFAKETDLSIEKIKNHPTAYPPEPFLPTKNNWYRFTLVMKSWKLIFKITNDSLIFLGIIHTSRHPREIKKLRTNIYE